MSDAAVSRSARAAASSASTARTASCRSRGSSSNSTLPRAHRLPGVDATSQKPTADLKRQWHLDARANRAAGHKTGAAAALHRDRTDPRNRLDLDRRRFGSAAGRQRDDHDRQQEMRLVHDDAS